MGLSEADRRLVSQIQGRTYANVFGLVERFINAKVLELGQLYSLDDQTALEALIGFSAEELKHQRLFRRVEQMAADTASGSGYNLTVTSVNTPRVPSLPMASEAISGPVLSLMRSSK